MTRMHQGAGGLIINVLVLPKAWYGYIPRHAYKLGFWAKSFICGHVLDLECKYYKFKLL